MCLLILFLLELFTGVCSVHRYFVARHIVHVICPITTAPAAAAARWWWSAVLCRLQILTCILYKVLVVIGFIDRVLYCANLVIVLFPRVTTRKMTGWKDFLWKTYISFCWVRCETLHLHVNQLPTVIVRAVVIVTCCGENEASWFYHPVVTMHLFAIVALVKSSFVRLSRFQVLVFGL